VDYGSGFKSCKPCDLYDEFSLFYFFLHECSLQLKFYVAFIYLILLYFYIIFYVIVVDFLRYIMGCSFNGNQ
jgi:hypothetical protein